MPDPIRRTSLMLGSLALLMVALPAIAGPDPLDTLVAAERAFAKLSVEHGMRDAFLAYMADDGVVFRPTAVNAKSVWQPRAPSAATLAWEPEYAEVSASGDLGYTTGPWRFTGANATSPSDFGHFISVWRRGADGTWKVVADIGTGHERPGADSVGSGTFTAGPKTKAAKSSSQALKDVASDPRSLDRSASGGGRPARALLLQVGAADLRFNTNGKPPAIGLTAASVRIDSLTNGRRVLFRPDVGGASSSHDLVYSYGIAELAFPGEAPDSCAYLNVWRLSSKKRWELAMSVINPLNE